MSLFQLNSNKFILGGGGSKTFIPNTSHGSLWYIDSLGNLLSYIQTEKIIANILDVKDGHIIFNGFNYLSKIDTAGNIIWSIGFNQYVKPSNVIKTKNNTYCYLYHDSLQNIFIKEISENGTVLRDDSFPFFNINAESDLFIQDSAGDFLLATDEGSLVLRKFNSNLELSWLKLYSTQLYLFLFGFVSIV